MQSIFSSLRSIADGRVSLGIGLGLLGLLLVVLLIEIFRALLRLRFERIHQRLSAERLRWQLQETKFRVEEAKQAQLQWNGLHKFRVAKKNMRMRGSVRALS
jgi:hypothetical protein